MVESTVRTIIKNKEKLKALGKAMTASGIEHSLDTRQITSECSVRMEKLLSLWLQDLETRNFPVSLKQIQEKARRLHEAIKENCTDL